MGNYENELTSIAAAPDWSVPMLVQMENALPDLVDLMRKIAGETGLTGASAESAQESFTQLKGGFEQLHKNVVELNKSIQRANDMRREAAHAGLPSATVDPATHAAILAVGGVTIPGVGLLVAEGGIQLYQNFLRGQREEVARKSLDQLQSNLASQPLPVRPIKEFSDPRDPSTPPESDHTVWPTTPSNRPDFGPSGGGYDGPDGRVSPSPSSAGAGSGSGGSQTAPSVDGDLGGGYVPGSSGVGGGNGGGGLPFRPGGGLGGLVSGGAGAAALAVGARLGGSGMAGAGGGLGGFGSAGGSSGGLSGAAAKPGAGGLLGGAKGGVGVPGEAAGGSGAAGSRPSGAMMGGGQGGAGGSDKEKRSGLGGPMAPKLEDDIERGPRSAGAMAGGRDTAVSDEPG